MSFKSLIENLLGPFRIRQKPAWWPVVTVLLCLSLILTSWVFGFTPGLVESELNKVLDDTHIASITSKLLVEYCEANIPDNKNCDDDAASAALYIVNHESVGLRPSAAELIWRLRTHEEAFSTMPVYEAYSLASQWAKEGLNKISDVYHVLAGTHWSFTSALLSMWLHTSFDHILTNLILLLLVGVVLERQIYRVNLVGTFLVGGLLSTRIFLPWLVNDYVILSGCSAGIYALLGVSVVVIAKRLERTERERYSWKFWDWMYLGWFFFALFDVARQVWRLQAAPIPWGRNNILHLIAFALGTLWGVVCVFILKQKKAPEAGAV